MTGPDRKRLIETTEDVLYGNRSTGVAAEIVDAVLAALPAEPEQADREMAERYGYTPRDGQSASYVTVSRSLIEEAHAACLDGDAKSLLARVLEKAQPVRAADREPTYPAGSRDEQIQLELLSARTRIICDLDLHGALECIGRALNALSEPPARGEQCR